MNLDLIAPEVIQRLAGSLLHFVWQGAVMTLRLETGDHYIFQFDFVIILLLALTLLLHCQRGVFYVFSNRAKMRQCTACSTG